MLENLNISETTRKLWERKILRVLEANNAAVTVIITERGPLEYGIRFIDGEADLDEYENVIAAEMHTPARVKTLRIHSGLVLDVQVSVHGVTLAMSDALEPREQLEALQTTIDSLTQAHAELSVDLEGE